MGSDEHGPAYPEPRAYRCPICRGDQNRYMTCDYPACPDGRDQARFRSAPVPMPAAPTATHRKPTGRFWGWVCFFALLLLYLAGIRGN